MKIPTYIIVLFVIFVLGLSLFSVNFSSMSVISQDNFEVTGVIYQEYFTNLEFQGDHLAAANIFEELLISEGFTITGVRCTNLVNGLCLTYGVYGVPPSTGESICFPSGDSLCTDALVDPTGLTTFFYCNVDDVVSCPEGCEDGLCNGAVSIPNCNEGFEICDGNDAFVCENGAWSLKNDCFNFEICEELSFDYARCRNEVELFCFESFQQRCTSIFVDEIQSVSLLNQGDCFLELNDCKALVDSDVCPDGICSAFESVASCPLDCQSGVMCGDGVCGFEETEISCPSDCLVEDGDSKSQFPIVLTVIALILLLFIVVLIVRYAKK